VGRENQGTKPISDRKTLSTAVIRRHETTPCALLARQAQEGKTRCPAARSILVIVKTNYRSFKAAATLGLGGIALIAGAACSGGTGDESVGKSGQAASTALGEMGFKPLCAELTGPHTRRCRSWVRVDNSTGKIHANAASSGPVAGTYGPADLKSAYDLPSTGGSGITVALVDAQDDPKAESDLAVYRSYYGLPACTTANGCFKKVDQNGGTSYPTEDDGWSGEISLDLDMVSAGCPSCKILLVEATSADDADLEAAEAQAAKLGAKAISNSWSGPEDSTVTTESNAYNFPGVSVLAASGDDGFSMGTQFPASSQYVIAVGGTELDKSTTAARGWTEVVWGTTDPSDDGATGSGCSAYIPKPSWQKDPTCKFKMNNDVSAVADVVPGLAVYDTENAQSSGEGTGWVQIGGTSAATPLTAAILAVTGQAGVTPQFFYENTATSLYDVTSGNNGTCSTAYYCKGEVGYDGPTGFGTPNASGWESTPPPPVDAGAPDAGHDSGAPSGNLLTNGNFATGTLADWTIAQGSVTIAADFAQNSATGFSARIGSKTAFSGYAILDHELAVPATGTTTLSYYGSYICPDKSTAEWERVRILNSSKVAVQTISEECDNTRPWVQTTADLTAYAGQTIYLQFTAHDDDTSTADRAFWYLSNASVTNTP
jgi:hypothetical protein